MDDLHAPLIEAVEAVLGERAQRDGKEKGRILRMVIITEEMIPSDIDGRRLSWLSRAVDGSGLYEWESLSLINYAKMQLEDQCREGWHAGGSET